MSPDSILAIIFVLLSIGLVFFISRSNFDSRKLKKFTIAATCVYISGTVLIAVLSVVVSKLTVAHIIIMEAVILFVFVFDVIILRRMARYFDELHEEAVKNKETQSPDEEKI